MLPSKDINTHIIDEQDIRVQNLSCTDLQFYIFEDLAYVNINYLQDAKLLLAIHDAEIVAAVPDTSQLSIYINLTDSELMHSYFYHSYLFSTALCKLNNKWIFRGIAKKINEIKIMALDNMIYPFTFAETIWIYDMLHNPDINLQLYNKIDMIMNKLSHKEQLKLYSDAVLLKISN